jgi:excisionase family DNA binding protein
MTNAITEQAQVEWESLTIKELADLLQLNQETVRNWVNAGELEYIQVGGAKRIPRHAAVALAGGVESFRATLKRLFVGFELTSPTKPFGSGVLRGQVWSDPTPGGEHPEDPMLALGDGCMLLPVVRPQVIDWTADQAEGFPAVRRVALSLSDNLCARFAAW